MYTRTPELMAETENLRNVYTDIVVVGVYGEIMKAPIKL